MSNIILLRYCSHRWRNQTRCINEGREDYGVTYSYFNATYSRTKLETTDELLCTWIIGLQRVCAKMNGSFSNSNTSITRVVLEWSIHWMPPRSPMPPTLLPNKWIRRVSASWPTLMF